jgi:hypothetical protein
VTRALARFSRGVRNTINSVVNRSKFPESLCDQINQAIPNVEKAVAPVEAGVDEGANETG